VAIQSYTERACFLAPGLPHLRLAMTEFVVPIMLFYKIFIARNFISRYYIYKRNMLRLFNYRLKKISMADAQPIETQKPDNKAQAQAVSSGADEYYLDKNRYHRVSCAETKDEVDSKYIVDIARPLQKFDSGMGKAFGVTNKLTKESEKLFAMVLDKRYPVRLAEINKLLEQTYEGMVNVIAAQIVPLSVGKGRFFVVILEKPKGIPLAEYVANNGAISEDAVIKKVVPALSYIIGDLAKKDIVHGRINLNNVFIDESGHLTIGECISEVCGYSQPIAYETVNRACANHIGKGVGISGSTDYYALGVLVAIMMRGKNPFDGLSDNEILDKKLSDTTYRIVIDAIELSPRILDFLRGVINDDTEESWNWDLVDDWVRGRRFNLLAQSQSSDAGRAITFNEKKYLKKRYLAHDLYLNWDAGKKFIREQGILIKWIERGVGDSDLAEKMEVLSNRTGGGDMGSLFDKDDELLAQYIILLDPNGPFRLRNFSALADGVGAMLADAYTHNKQQVIDAVANIINHSLVSYLDNNPNELERSTRDYFAEAVFTLQKCKDFSKKPGIGFGFERCLYELNPTISCQSNIISDYVVFSSPDLLKNLNINNNLAGKAVDRQMAAFISMRLDLSTQIRIPSLARFPDFAQHPNIQSLALLSMAQQNSGIAALPGLSEKIIAGLKNVIDDFHSKFVRIDLIEELAKIARKGSLQHILRIITDPQYLVRDRLGFRRAVTRYRNNAIQIAKLSNRSAVNNMGYRYGLQLAVLFSFFVTTIVVLVLMMKAF
jgi:hypothetical protein